MLVMRDGAITGHGASNDAALHAALVEAFDRAIAVVPPTASGKRPTVSLRLDD
jgi:ribosomal protein S12 methylthiotransferase accessory factor YcaO